MKTNRYYIAALLTALLFMTIHAHAQIPPVVSTEKIFKIKFQDSTKIVLTGSNTVAKRLAAYKAATAGKEFIIVGKGSGELDLGVLLNAKIKIKPGSYSKININKATNSMVDATGVLLPGGWVDLRDINGLDFCGFSVTGIKGRAVAVRGICTKLRIHHANFDGIGDIAIAFENRDEGTLNENSEVSYCTFNDIGAGVSIGAGFSDKGVPQGFSTGFKFLHNTLTNCPSIGNWLSVNVGDDVTADYNTVSHVNYKFDATNKNGTHNRLIMITGNGRARYNTANDYQGNFIAFWGITLGTVMKDVEIANNTASNTWKYGMFELQVPPYFLQMAYANPGKISYTNADVHHNVGGDFNRSLDWEGQMLDLYNTQGGVKFHHNVGFKMNRVTGYDANNKPITTYANITDMINYNGSGTSMQINDNKYLPTEAEVRTFLAANTSYGVQ